MKIIDLRVLRGPNVWTRCRVLEVTLEVATKDAAGRAAVLERAFRPWVNLGAPVGSRSGPCDDGAVLAKVWASLVVQLQSLAWKPVSFACVERAFAAGLYRVLVEYHDEDLAEACATRRYGSANPLTVSSRRRCSQPSTGYARWRPASASRTSRGRLPKRLEPEEFRGADSAVPACSNLVLAVGSAKFRARQRRAPARQGSCRRWMPNCLESLCMLWRSPAPNCLKQTF